MNWATGLCDAPGNNMANAATDGDLDVAMALLQAQARWPGGNYLEQAKALAGKIAMFESETCGTRRVLKPGDAFGGCSDKNGQDKLNPSYFAPGYYRVFQQFTGDTYWGKAADDVVTLYALAADPTTGIIVNEVDQTQGKVLRYADVRVRDRQP